MCLVCNTGIPVCNLIGGCSIEVLDYIKIVAMTGGASMGVAVTSLRAHHESRKNHKNEQGK